MAGLCLGLGCHEVMGKQNGLHRPFAVPSSLPLSISLVTSLKYGSRHTYTRLGPEAEAVRPAGHRASSWREGQVQHRRRGPVPLPVHPGGSRQEEAHPQASPKRKGL